jgi:hypothetical protein
MAWRARAPCRTSDSSPAPCCRPPGTSGRHRPPPPERPG